MCIDILSSNEVLDLARSYNTKWRSIGVALGVSTAALNDISRNCSNDDDRLSNLISRWLCGSVPRPTRHALTIALKSLDASNNLKVLSAKGKVHTIIKSS